MSIPCRLCNSEESDPQYRIGEYSVLKCNQCGFAFSSPLPSVETIYGLYKNRYFNSPKDIGYPDYTENKKIRAKTFEYYYTLIEPYLSARNRALDIGCADGSFLEVLKTKGFPDNQGIELNEEQFLETQKRFFLYKEPIEKVKIEHTFDLITIFDVLEHIPDLRSAITNMHSLLNEEGLLVILTPDYGSLQRKLKGKKWFQFKPMEHINYFTKKRLTEFLESSGFEVLSESSGVSLVDREFIMDRLKRYNYSFLGSLFSVFGKLIFLNKEFIKVSNSSIFIIAKRA